MAKLFRKLPFFIVAGIFVGVLAADHNDGNNGQGLQKTIRQIGQLQGVKLRSISAFFTATFMIIGLLPKAVIELISARMHLDRQILQTVIKSIFGSGGAVQTIFHGLQHFESLIGSSLGAGGSSNILGLIHGILNGVTSSIGIGGGGSHGGGIGGGISIGGIGGGGSQGGSNGSGGSQGGSNGSGGSQGGSNGGSQSGGSGGWSHVGSSGGGGSHGSSSWREWTHGGGTGGSSTGGTGGQGHHGGGIWGGWTHGGGYPLGGGWSHGVTIGGGSPGGGT